MSGTRADVPLRVLFASTHTYLPQRAGGVESSIHDLCTELRRRGDAPAVLARIAPEGWLGLVNRVRRKLPFEGDFPSDRRMGYPVYRGWVPEHGVDEVRGRFEPDVAVVQGSGPVPLARTFLSFDLPTALYLRDVEFDRLGGEIPADPRLLVIANSEFTASRAARDLGLKAHVLPPLIRPEAYRTRGDGSRVLFVNPHPWKGVDIAFALAERRPDVPFLFLQSWKLRSDLRAEYAERAAKLPNVEWRDPVDDMKAIYAQTRLALVPSRWEEAWGRIATEAHVSGIPVLASERGGLPESVGPGGILVDPEGPIEAWVAALGRVWDDPETWERLSASAREYARRPAIQPDVLVSRLRELLIRHAGSASR